MKAHIQSGLDNLESVDHLLRGRRVGLMTNPTGVDHSLKSSIDIINAKYNLTALLACEHGIRGDAQAGAHVETVVVPKQA